MKIVLRNIPDLPPEAAGYEVVEELTVPEIGDYGLSTLTKWEPVKDYRWGLTIVARKPKPRGLAFIETLEPGTVFVHEGELYARGPHALRTVTTEHIILIAEKRFYSSGHRSWMWDNDKEPIDFAADNCRIIWPESKEQDQS